jgi:hypothetical protein
MTHRDDTHTLLLIKEHARAGGGRLWANGLRGGEVLRNLPSRDMPRLGDAFQDTHTHRTPLRAGPNPPWNVDYMAYTPRRYAGHVGKQGSASLSTGFAWLVAHARRGCQQPHVFPCCGACFPLASVARARRQVWTNALRAQCARLGRGTDGRATQWACHRRRPCYRLAARRLLRAARVALSQNFAIFFWVRPNYTEISSIFGTLPVIFVTPRSFETFRLSGKDGGAGGGRPRIHVHSPTPGVRTSHWCDVAQVKERGSHGNSPASGACLTPGLSHWVHFSRTTCKQDC